jgi:hypothetical protein
MAGKLRELARLARTPHMRKELIDLAGTIGAAII